ncbi:flavodoxin domain-containing protein [Streptomyces pristinaespiralis]|uniref:flavodoxin domain-containing protein n=1 Tax=Streptomyces pristinaespiralis TaxID=38300 RepID=UPI00340A5BF6
MTRHTQIGREGRDDGRILPRVLVAYAGVHGSTRSIAERLAAYMNEVGLRAACRPVGTVDGPLDYDAYVIGSAVHDMRWLPDASAFVRDHAIVLRRRPVWIFSVGVPAALRGPWRTLVAKEAGVVAREAADILRPRGQALFSGVIGPEHLPVSGRLRMRAMGLRYGDYRDWEAVDAWARGIAGDLGG